MTTVTQLIDKVKSYDPQANAELIAGAYAFAMEAHQHQKRESGEPYFTHPVAVAMIITEMKLDTASIVTALLHDTIEDTPVTHDEIEKKFGQEIVTLVDGATKLTQIELQSINQQQAENFRKLVLAMSNDIRVLLVKLADRLHNMRTLVHVKSEEKRKRIARETMDIYAPLAGRIGVHHLKDELEDLAFIQLNPDGRASIMSRLKFLREEGEDTVGSIIQSLKKLFRENDLKVEISGREKTPYSIWLKMHRQNIGFEQLADIIAFRVLVDTIEECYQALGIVHSSYPVVPGRFKDYISTPKPNHYQSLHTAIIGPNQQRIEIQIRTFSMHEVNEYGVAAHWKYKQGARGQEGDEFRWLRGLLEILESAADPEEFLEHTKLEMYQDQVFCFTPRGDLISLPTGATPIDFAYSVHSEIGNHCVAAKINGRMVPLRTVLHNGDQVEITTSKAQAPSPTWERYAVTGKARACIRRYIRNQKRAQFIELGRSMLHKNFKQEGFDYSEKLIEKHLKDIGCASLDDLFALIGEGLKTSQDIIRKIYPEYTQKRRFEPPLPSEFVERKESGTAMSIKGLIPGMAIHYAGCCHPLPGDRIVGIVMTGRGVTVHTYDCDNVSKFADDPDRILDIAWGDQRCEESSYVGRLHIILFNKVGSLAGLTTMIGKGGGNISNLKIIHRSEEFFDLIVDVEVKDAQHLSAILAAMRSASMVSSVERSRG
ncbi:MAG: bifunctional (p)ppGpp synthetase/guanosine-3',5'-bis(diphosphate) 3'-pyrophosphohydrolase [Pseudomonadota bacterium]